jgi:hypothetical protein
LVDQDSRHSELSQPGVGFAQPGCSYDYAVYPAAPEGFDDCDLPIWIVVRNSQKYTEAGSLGRFIHTPHDLSKKGIGNRRDYQPDGIRFSAFKTLRV